MDVDVERIHRTAQRWTHAIAEADIVTLRQLMTEDIVVIHGNGRMLQGREAVAVDVAKSLAQIRVQQRVDSEETIVAGDWAFDRARVHTIATPRRGGESTQWDSRTLTVLHRDSGGQWRVARAIGVVEQPLVSR